MSWESCPVLCPHAVMLARISKAGMHTEEIISALKNLAIYASSFFIFYSESLGRAPFLVLFSLTAVSFCFYAQSQPWDLWLGLQQPLGLLSWFISLEWWKYNSSPLLRTSKMFLTRKEFNSWENSWTTRMEFHLQTFWLQIWTEIPTKMFCVDISWCLQPLSWLQNSMHSCGLNMHLQFHFPNAVSTGATLKYPQGISRKYFGPVHGPHMAQAFRKINQYYKTALIRPI